MARLKGSVFWMMGSLYTTTSHHCQPTQGTLCAKDPVAATDTCFYRNTQAPIYVLSSRVIFFFFSNSSIKDY